MLRYTLITGATSGIGLELARIYAAKAENLILVARREEILKDLAEELAEQYQIRVHIFAGDLSRPETARSLVQWTREKGYEVDTLINNAGFGSYGEFHKSDLKKEWEMLQLNVMTLMYLTRAFLPGMVFRGRGGVLNVASVAAFAPGPKMADYYASKAYVLSFTQALAAELRNTKLKISTLCPGPAQTGFQEHAGLSASKQFRQMAQSGLSAKQVARYAYQRFQRGEAVIIPGLSNQILAVLARKLPMKLVRWVIACLQ